MKREFRHENFEDFLKRNADNLRMKAPEKVWENLSKHLTKERRRWNAGLSAFLLFTGLLGYLSISTTTQKALPRLQQDKPIEKTAAAPTNKAASQEPRSGKNVSRRARPVVLSNNRQQPRELRALPNTLSLLLSSPDETLLAKQDALKSANEFTPTVVDDNLGLASREATSEAAAKPSFLLSHDATPWSIESVVNSYKRPKSRFQTQFHFTPTISYRKLSENKSYLRNATLLNTPPNYAVLYGNVSNMVTHKPDLGFELGFTEKYSLSQKLRVLAGLQFNVNRYDIKAFNTPYSYATIALRSNTGTSVDYISAPTSYSNESSSGKTTSWLQNFSFQASAPVGAELALTGSEKMQFGIGTTVQPTYVLGDRAYLITTNYKSYTQVPWLLRRWNVNTAFEAFVAYQAGKARWQVGPQVRYQLLSSFISNYPVKENLFDFGLKIGVSFPK